MDLWETFAVCWDHTTHRDFTTYEAGLPDHRKMSFVAMVERNGANVVLTSNDRGRVKNVLLPTWDARVQASGRENMFTDAEGAVDPPDE